MKNHEMKTGRRRSPVAPHHQGARAHSRPRCPMVRPPRSSFPSRFSPVITSQCLIFVYITPRIARGLYIVFSSCFHFELFLSGVDLSFGSIMAPSSDDKGKKPMEEDHQDRKRKKEPQARGSRARDPTFVGSMNTRRAFSHNMQGQHYQSWI
jgi:hypothetical protein